MKVESMAEDLLKSGYTAGKHYGEAWIRDLNTFIELAIKVNGAEEARELLLLFFKFQGEDGNIPDGYRPIESDDVGYKYIYSETAPDYKAHKNTMETDQETSLIQAVYKYIRITSENDFLNKVVDGKTVRERMEGALDFLLKNRINVEYSLIWGATTIDWGDVQPEHIWGVELDSSSHPTIDIYDNAMFSIAIQNFCSLINDR